MAGEFSFAELVQTCQGRRKKGVVVQSNTVHIIEATIIRPRDPSSVQPSVHLNAGLSVLSIVPVKPSVGIEVRDPIVLSPAVPVPESSSNKKPMSLKRKGKRLATSDPEEVPLKTHSRMSEPSVSEGQTLNLPPSFFGTTVPILLSPRKSIEDEESILFNRSFALKVVSSVVPIPDRQYIMNGGLQRTMNDISISAAQVKVDSFGIIL